MGIPRGKSCAVIQQHLITVAAVPAADQHRAAVGRQNGVPSGAGMSVPRCPALPRYPPFRNGRIYKCDRQRPLQGCRHRPRRRHRRTTQQIRAQFVRQQLVKNVALVLREIVFFSQLGCTLLLTVMCRMYSVTGSGSGSSSVGSGVVVTVSISEVIWCMDQKVF